VNAETLRYYERRGLLDEPPRSVGGYRAYPDSAVDVVRFVKRNQELGFSLDEIDELLHLANGGPDDCDQVRIQYDLFMVDLGCFEDLLRAGITPAEMDCRSASQSIVRQKHHQLDLPLRGKQFRLAVQATLR
jgi:DNA-binding transcriptional MerR regulator